MHILNRAKPHDGTAYEKSEAPSWTTTLNVDTYEIITCCYTITNTASNNGYDNLIDRSIIITFIWINNNISTV